MRLLMMLSVALATGLHGTVMRSPTTPVCRVGVPCSAPAKGVLLRFASPKLTRTARTDARGRYAVALPSGVYTVSTAAPTAIGRGIEPRRVRVGPGAPTLVNFTIDTGIR
jgi:hypothetical protein